MNSIEKIVFFLLPLSVLFSELTFIPNRIIMSLCLLWLVFRDKQFINYLLRNKWLLFLGIIYLLIIVFSNKFLSNEAVLFLTIPIYVLIYNASSLPQFYFKKYFILATFTYAVFVLLSKAINIASVGFLNFFEREQWWNELMYKSLAEPLHGHPTYIAMFITAAIVLILHIHSDAKKYFSTKQTIAILATLTFVLLLLIVKISYLALGLIILIYLIFLLKRKKIKEVFIGSTLMIIMGLAVFNTNGVKQRIFNDLNMLKSSSSQADSQNRLKERAALWKSSIDFIEKNPFVGSSFMGKSSKESIYPLAKQFYPQMEYSKNCHNNYLEFGVRYGLLGILVFLLFTFMYAKLGIKEGSFEIIGIAVLICVFSLTESFMFREQGISFVAIFTAIFGKQVYGKDI